MESPVHNVRFVSAGTYRDVIGCCIQSVESPVHNVRFESAGTYRDVIGCCIQSVESSVQREGGDDEMEVGGSHLD